MLNGDKMIKAIFDNNKFTIMISVDRFKEFWDESYFEEGGYKLNSYREILEIESGSIDLNSFVAEQILSVLNDGGEEDENANNEYFEDFDAENCAILNIVDDTVIISGRLSEF